MPAPRVHSSALRALRSGAPSRSTAVGLVVAFAAVHALLAFLDLRDHVRWPLGDVVGPYAGWATAWLEHGVVWGVDAPWVYPAGALPPMLAALALGPQHYGLTWLLIVTLLDAVTTFALARRRPVLAWWWLAFTLCLGPVAIGRIDAVALPVALFAVLLLGTRPGVASVLLTIATWIKVWPVALIASMLVTGPRRLRVLLASAAACAAVVVLALLAGADGDLFGFLGQQTGRALQVEAPISWPWLLLATQGLASVYYDKSILTIQVAGPGALETAALMTPLLLVVLVVVFAGSLLAVRRGADAGELLPFTALASVAALIAVNKVGSPQYATWLAAPVVLGLLVLGRRFSVPAVGTIAIAAMTQVIYPWFYESLVQAEPWMVAFIGVRDALEVALLVWAVAKIVAAAQHGAVPLAGSPRSKRFPLPTAAAARLGGSPDLSGRGA